MNELQSQLDSMKSRCHCEHVDELIHKVESIDGRVDSLKDESADDYYGDSTIGAC